MAFPDLLDYEKVPNPDVQKAAGRRHKNSEHFHLQVEKIQQLNEQKYGISAWLSPNERQLKSQKIEMHQWAGEILQKNGNESFF